METIRRYFASGCDVASMTDEELDALKKEARKKAGTERRMAVRMFFAGLFGRRLTCAERTPTLARRPGVG